MKKIHAIFAAAACVAVGAMAYDAAWLRLNSGVSLGVAIEEAKSIGYGDDNSSLVVTMNNGESFSVAAESVTDMTFGTADDWIDVAFDGPSAAVGNPYPLDSNLSVEMQGANVTIRSSSDRDIVCHVSGTTGSGQFKLYSTGAATVVLDNADITNTNGSAINLQCEQPVKVELVGASKLCDSKKYNATPAGEDEKSTLFAVSDLTLQGTGSVEITGTKKHGISSNGAVTVAGGDIVIAKAAGDGINATGFSISGGAVTTRSTSGDGIDAGAGSLIIDGGTVDVAMTADDVKGLKADDVIVINAGSVKVDNASLQGKAIKSKADITINGGNINITTSGEGVVVDGDPSYCTAIKSDANFFMTEGSLTIVTTGRGAKGISADLDATFTGGTVNATATGDGVVYVDASGNNDTYTSNCITVDGNLYVYGGTFVLNNSGSAGKGMKSDLNTVIGNAGGDGPDITINLSGKRVSENTVTPAPGGGGWGPGGGGHDPNADYANPKGIKAKGNLTVNSGTLNLSCTGEGGEALESKATLTINDGVILALTIDDCMNAATHIQINGGKIRCISSSNDAIDSNGTLTLAGGVVIAVGARAPECGFDCDNNRFAITGGVLVGMGGDESTPTSSACTQRVLVYRVNFAQNAVLTMVDPSGNQILSFKNPANLGTAKMILSSPLITTGTHRLYTGGTVSGGESFCEITTGASYSPGTSLRTFSPSSMVTTINY